MLSLMPKLYYMTKGFKLVNDYKFINLDTIKH